MRKLAILLLPMPVVEWLVRIKTAILFNKFTIERIHNNYQKTIKRLQKKIQKGEKIRVCFFVMRDSMFQTRPLFEKMLQTNLFIPFIVVIPDISRGKQFLFSQMEKTYKYLAKQYRDVYMSYNYDSKQFMDWSKDIDIAFFNNPYDEATHQFYRIRRHAKKGILTCYTEYAYTISNRYYRLIKEEVIYDILWKIFALEKLELAALQQNKINGTNAILTGYCKMDEFITYQKAIRQRPKIIIAPHHSVGKVELALSTFLQYSTFFLSLPARYPQIDFIFRPHPLLWIHLVQRNFWKEQQIGEYIQQISSYPNVEYQNGENYLETFANSDGLIHDCGSFSAEYLFTGNPCCYLLKSPSMTKQNSNCFHRQCLAVHYQAYQEQDIIRFIEQVILNKQDPLKEQRYKFYEQAIKENYPNTSSVILHHILHNLGQDEKI